MKTTARQIVQKVSVSLLILLVSRCCNAGSASEPTSFGAWAVATNSPLKGFLSPGARLVVSESSDDFGTRTAITYVEFQNTNNSINTIFVHSSFTLNCELRDSNGKSIPSSANFYNGLVPNPSWLALPYDSILRCRPNPPALWKASNGELLIAAGMNCWHIPRGATNEYYLSGTLSLTVPTCEPLPDPGRVEKDELVADPEVRRCVSRGELKLPPVKISAKSL
jgi:hypothetical protein